MVMRGRPGGHRSGAGSGGAGIDKCTEVANGKHNTKIDKLLQHELNDANRCKKCTPPKQPDGGGPAVQPANPSPGSPQPRDTHGEDAEGDTPPAQDDASSDEEEGDEGEDDEEGEEAEVAEDTKKKGHTH